MRITSLYRYPVKGFSPERLTTVPLAVGDGFPLDRKYALLRTNAAFDSSAPVWLAKANFVMLMVHEQIATLKTEYREQDDALTIVTPDGKQQVFMLSEPSGRAGVEQFFQRFMPKHLPNPPRLVEAAGHQFTDKAAKYVSLINLASVRELEKRWGEELDPLRFRANVYIDGAEPFSELDWVGQRIQLGSVVMKVMQRNGRCAATNVNPDTGVRDRNVPGKLREDFGHKDLGVYLAVASNGVLHEGDPISVGNATGDPNKQVSVMGQTDGQLICSACYYLFDPRKFNTDWTGARDLPESWRCPDCGSTRDAVQAASAN